MKDSINHIIAKYGIGDAKYGLIVFGDTAVPKVAFSDNFKDGDALRSHIQTVPRSTQGPAYDKALVEADVMFQSSAARANAKKVLVVMVDKGSNSDKSVVR